jgi:ubiquinol-cytochrome c reductase cytochrome c subunit
MRRLGRPRLLVAAVVAAGALGVTALAAAQPPTGIRTPANTRTVPLRELGSELFAANCSTCHGIDARGVSSQAPQRGAGNVTGMGPSLRGVGAGTIDFYLRLGYMPLSTPDEQPSRHAPWFSPREIKGLITYITSLGPPGPPIPSPRPEEGDLSKGMQLFTEHCAGCHQVVAQGGIVTGARVPPLQDEGPVDIAEAVRTGPYLMPRFSKSQISDRELNSIIRYVQLTRDPPNRGGWGIGNIGPLTEGLVAGLAAILLAFSCMFIGRRYRRE